MTVLIGGIMIGTGITMIVATLAYERLHAQDVDLDEPIWEFGSEDQPWTTESINKVNDD